jgi:hypothetical protein
MHLIKNKVHDINLEINILISGQSTKVGMIEQVNQGGMNGIIVTSSWSNSVPEQVLQLIIEEEEPGDSAHLLGGSVELIERILVWPSRVEKTSTNIGPSNTNPKASAKSWKEAVH